MLPYLALTDNFRKTNVTLLKYLLTQSHSHEQVQKFNLRNPAVLFKEIESFVIEHVLRTEYNAEMVTSITKRTYNIVYIQFTLYNITLFAFSILVQ